MADKLFVCKGAICKCTLQTMPGILDVTSQSIKKLEGKLQATEGDKTFSTPFGNCMRTPNSPPPCTPGLSKWDTVAKATKVDGKLALLEISTNICSFGGQIEITDPNQTIGKTSDVPTNEIVNPFKGEVHFKRRMETGAAYALYPDGLNDIAQNQIYGFDWIRDVLDGDENVFNLQPTIEKQISSFSGEIPTAVVGNFQNTATIRLGKYIHYSDFAFASRKLKSEDLIFISNIIYTITGNYTGSKGNDMFFTELINALNGKPSPISITGQSTNSSGEIIEYNTNRSKKNTYVGGTANYTKILTKIGGSYAAAQSSLLLTSFEEIFREHAPAKQYIDTPDGTERTGNNTGKITLNLNGKNYYTPWLAALKSETIKLYALFFLDAAAPPGEIRFEASNTNIKIKPDKLAASSLAVHAYPTTVQTSDAVPKSNKVELDISFTSSITTNETIEVRFYDDKKKSGPNYKGDVIGLLNVLKNDKEYEVTLRYVKVYFTDDNNWLVPNTTSDDNQLPTGPNLPPNGTIGIGAGAHTQAEQLARGQDLMNLFKLGGSQHPYLEHIFRQALIHYKNPIRLADSDAIAIDISEVFTKTEIQTGTMVVFSKNNITFPTPIANKFNSSIQQLAKAKVNASKGNHDGVTVALIPYTFNNLYGVSDGIGGSAKNVFITYLKYLTIGTDRATAAHEALHSLGLYHSFVDGGELGTYIVPSTDALTKSVKMKTENVMDYTPAARSLYKWQWEKIQQDLPDVKPKP